MTDSYRPHTFRFCSPILRPLRYGFAIPIAALFWACNFGQASELEQRQADNIRLTKTLHACLNRQDWKAIGGLCAETVRYRSRATHFAEVDEPKAQFLAHYRAALNADRPGAFEVRQLYPAGSYHIIAEGIVKGTSLPTTTPMCLIYTIEDQYITRLHVY